jgi:hypothetical protein
MNNPLDVVIREVEPVPKAGRQMNGKPTILPGSIVGSTSIARPPLASRVERKRHVRVATRHRAEKCGGGLLERTF